MVFSICFVFSFQVFLQLLCMSLVSLIFRYSAQILLENTLFCRQNARLKNRLFCSKFCWPNLSKPRLIVTSIFPHFVSVRVLASSSDWFLCCWRLCDCSWFYWKQLKPVLFYIHYKIHCTLNHLRCQCFDKCTYCAPVEMVFP